MTIKPTYDEVVAAYDKLVMEKERLRQDLGALQDALVGNTGLSAIQEAQSQSRPVKDAITQLQGARERYKRICRGIGEPVVSVPLDYLGVAMSKGKPQVFISIKDLTTLVTSVLAG